MARARTRAANVVRLRRRLRASPEAVFAAWTDPASIESWMTPFGTATADIDLRVGGAFRIVMADEGVRIEHTGEYLEVVPPERLTFTWRSPYTADPPGRVTVNLARRGTGTELTRVHEDLPAEVVESHTDGWSRMLDRLASLTEMARISNRAP